MAQLAIAEEIGTVGALHVLAFRCTANLGDHWTLEFLPPSRSLGARGPATFDWVKQSMPPALRVGQAKYDALCVGRGCASAQPSAPTKTPIYFFALLLLFWRVWFFWITEMGLLSEKFVKGPDAGLQWRQGQGQKRPAACTARPCHVAGSLSLLGPGCQRCTWVE